MNKIEIKSTIVDHLILLEFKIDPNSWKHRNIINIICDYCDKYSSEIIGNYNVNDDKTTIMVSIPQYNKIEEFKKEISNLNLDKISEKKFLINKQFQVIKSFVISIETPCIKGHRRFIWELQNLIDEYEGKIIEIENKKNYSRITSKFMDNSSYFYFKETINLLNENL